MSLHLSHTTVNAVDPERLAAFWSALADWRVQDSEPGEVYLIDDNGFTTLFIEVPDGKQVRNRVHLDLRPVGATQDEEVARAVELGASVLEDRRPGDRWVVLADPEGNEFCILAG
ncbi:MULTISPECIES: VOC family protein [Aeromicrobium]|uniref:VOC family protein n=1 Tax=Aeromicrobium yanjiei TaxID=2662028 RepID=A0A5Q2MD57_9ACTN|nr:MULTISPECIES: VOC family protein [Aeromicrobium]MRK02935.1 VOC family protein [Aeromicrobium sp. S22]QGG40498.1 VOC family protein [Aeromicrobium yanjiei]